MEAKYNKQVSELKCHYEKILLKNEEELYDLKAFKKESDYITGKLVVEADEKRKCEIDQMSKRYEKRIEQTRNDLQKEHLREIECLEKRHERELQKVSDLVEKLRREKRNSRNVMTN